jgi:hypothetical protein
MHVSTILDFCSSNIPISVFRLMIGSRLNGRYYRQLGGFKQEHDKAIQQICMLNAIAANKQAGAWV